MGITHAEESATYLVDVFAEWRLNMRMFNLKPLLRSAAAAQ